MAKRISASVGRGGANRPADVAIVQELLNNAGAAPRLVVDGKCGPKTNGAILTFQKRHFGRGDSRVDPGRKTIGKLNEFDRPGSRPPPGPASAPPTGLTPLRKKIIEIAKQQATPAPGKVSDRVTTIEPVTHKTVRAGWKQLQEYFDTAVSGWSPQHWKDYQILAGVQIPGRRIPQPGTDGIHWCGIFATWVLIKAGMPVKWRLGRGLSLPYTHGTDARPGDVCVKKGSSIHHFIVISDGDPMQTVNGNSDNQSILIKPTYRNQIAYYYKVD